jgi:phage gpG-like protein
MTFELDIQNLNFAEQIQARFDEIKVPIQAAMAGRFREIVMGNFGETGTDRPEEWPTLSPKYAKRVGRDEATLFVTGTLMDSVEIDPYNPDAAVVSTKCPYAMAHQYGEGNMPKRPFFPMTDLELTPYAEQQVMEAAQHEAERLLA